MLFKAIGGLLFAMMSLGSCLFLPTMLSIAFRVCSMLPNIEINKNSHVIGKNQGKNRDDADCW
jgi:hypothetical protein